VLEGRHVLVAVGAKPAELDLEGREHLVTSEQFLELDVLPPRVLFVGGGYISFEFGHIAARAGAKVTVVHHGQRPLNVTERSNAATEERLKSGHAVGGLSIV